jgi:hypothetical protein
MYINIFFYVQTASIVLGFKNDQNDANLWPSSIYIYIWVGSY